MSKSSDQQSRTRRARWFELDDDGQPEAEMPDDLDELARLTRSLRRAGYSSVTIDGEEWTIEAWGLSPWDVSQHPFLVEEYSIWLGESMLDKQLTLVRIGNHWFDWPEGDQPEHLGRFRSADAALAASELFSETPDGNVVCGLGDPAAASLLADNGIDTDDSNHYFEYESLGVDFLGAVLDSGAFADELLDQLGVVHHQLGLSTVEEVVEFAAYQADLFTGADPCWNRVLDAATPQARADGIPVADVVRAMVARIGHERAAVDERSARLPIGDEELGSISPFAESTAADSSADGLEAAASSVSGSTLGWARIDAALSGVSIGAALDRRIAAYDDISAHLDTWETTITEVDDGTGFRDAVAVAADAGVTLALVTAHNPMTVELSEDENERRNQLLLEEFHPPLRSVGRSSDGSWAEAGFAMRMGPAAIEAAQRFGQAAIFVVSPEGRQVLVLVGASPEELQRAAAAS